jgi:hypothetical protein
MAQRKRAYLHIAASAPVQIHGRGVSGSLAAIILIGAFALAAGSSLQGQGGGQPAGVPAELAAQTAALPPDPTPFTDPTPDLSPTQPRSAPRSPGDVAALPTGGTPLPDIAGALPGDDGQGPLPLGTVTDPPNPDRLDFLFEFCWPECFRDAHWMDPENPTVGSGVWTAGRPFHVREGFINERDEPLGDGFDVVLYVTRLGDGGDAATYRYTSDHVVRGTSERCGPTYETQTGPATCEWFVHDFAEGLPDGRFAIWAVWEAPCSAWIEMGSTDTCQDPDEVISLFSSGFDAPYTSAGPRFTEVEGPFTDPPGP